MKNSVRFNPENKHQKGISCEKNPANRKGKRRVLTKPELEHLLLMYHTRTKTTSEIAACFGVAASSVTIAAKRAGLPLRERGRKPETSPSPATQKIIREAWQHTYESVARRHGLSKQRVGQVVCRWRDWAVLHFGSRKTKLEKSLRKPEPIQKSPRRLRPHVISFRVSESTLAEILQNRADAGQFRKCSPHSAARSLLLRSLDNNRRASSFTFDSTSQS